MHKREHHRNECTEEMSCRDTGMPNDESVNSISKIIKRHSRFSCIHCAKKYKKKESLDGHIREHQGLDVNCIITSLTPCSSLTIILFQQPFECKLCDTTFQKLRSLLLHNDAKHNENFQKIPCVYEGCDKTFTTKFGLKEHIGNIHLGIKKNRTQSEIRYICELCGKFFKNKTSLKVNVKFHFLRMGWPNLFCPFLVCCFTETFVFSFR